MPPFTELSIVYNFRTADVTDRDARQAMSNLINVMCPGLLSTYSSVALPKFLSLNLGCGLIYVSSVGYY